MKIEIVQTVVTGEFGNVGQLDVGNIYNVEEEYGQMLVDEGRAEEVI